MMLKEEPLIRSAKSWKLEGLDKVFSISFISISTPYGVVGLILVLNNFSNSVSNFPFSVESTLKTAYFLKSIKPHEAAIFSAVSPLSPVSIHTLIFASLNYFMHSLTLS